MQQRRLQQSEADFPHQSSREVAVRSKLEEKKKKGLTKFRSSVERRKSTSKRINVGSTQTPEGICRVMNHVRFAKFAPDTKTLRPKISKEGGEKQMLASQESVCTDRKFQQTEVVTLTIRNSPQQLGPGESTNQ